MPEAIIRIRTLLAKQLEALEGDGMHTMSKAQWAEYYAREEQIAVLISNLSARQRTKHSMV